MIWCSGFRPRTQRNFRQTAHQCFILSLQPIENYMSFQMKMNFYFISLEFDTFQMLHNFECLSFYLSKRTKVIFSSSENYPSSTYAFSPNMSVFSHKYDKVIQKRI